MGAVSTGGENMDRTENNYVDMLSQYSVASNLSFPPPPKQRIARLYSYTTYADLLVQEASHSIPRDGSPECAWIHCCAYRHEL